MKFHFLHIVATLFCLNIALSTNAQISKEERLKVSERKALTHKAQELLKSEGNFNKAEVALRKAIAQDEDHGTAKYNLANTYFNQKKHLEANLRYEQATKLAETKKDKHQTYHNQGNNFMSQGKFEEAVEAYKNALRNDPTDDQTRHNYAVAKKMLEKNPPPPKQDQKQDQQNKDKKDQNKDQKDKKDQQNKDKKQDPKKEQGKDKSKDQNDPKKDPKDKNGDGQDPDKKNKGKDKEQQPAQPKTVKGKLSKEQMERLLEALNQHEKKVQDKMKEKEEKGIFIKTDKDW